MSKPVVRDATLGDLLGYHACLGQVAAERKFIGFVEAPPLESSEKWMRSVLETGYPFLVVIEGAHVVGWCDVGGREREGFRHTAELGMGLAAHVRGTGLGTALLERAIDLSRRLPIEKLELQVYASNHRARKLYERFGFEVEGVRVRARKLDEAYDDVILMAQFLTPANPPLQSDDHLGGFALSVGRR
jgi:RimJ/RimL family protein N-acetyltransferase